MRYGRGGAGNIQNVERTNEQMEAVCPDSRPFTPVFDA